jgi:hypothetical protein
METYHMVINRDILNRFEFLERSGLVEGMISIYFNSSEKTIDEIRSCFANSDKESIQKLAHDWRSNNLNIGAVAMADLLEELEKCCANISISSEMDEAEFKKKLEKIETEYQHTKSELIDFIHSNFNTSVPKTNISVANTSTNKLH